MHLRHNLAIWVRRYIKEMACLALLLALLMGWLALVLLINPRSSVATSGATWGQYVNQVYGRAAQEINRTVSNQSPEGWNLIQHLTVLPVGGDALLRFKFASPGQEGLVHYLREAPELVPPEGWDRQSRITAGATVPAGGLGIQIRIHDFQSRAAQNPEHFRATVEVTLHTPAGEVTSLVPTQTLEDTNSTLSWFVIDRMPPRLLTVWLAGGITAMVIGLLFGVIYFRLVAGTFIGPSWLAIPLNELRAATGLIGSSLIFLTGLVSVLLVFVFAPETGEALNPRRLHVDVLLEASEPVLPSTELGRPDNMIHLASRYLAEEVVGGLLPKAAKEETNAEVLTREAADFPRWVQSRMPVVLRMHATEFSISRGASWRVFGLTKKQAVPVLENMQWLSASRDALKQTLDQAYTLTRDRFEARSTAIPLPWDARHIPPLDPGTLASLRSGGQGGEGLRYARILLSSFQPPTLDFMRDWLQQAGQRPGEERVYSVMLPSLPRSATRIWEALESRLLCARAVSDRVVCTYPIPEGLTELDPRRLGMSQNFTTPPRPDIELAVFPSGGSNLRHLANFALPRNLAAERATWFAKADGLVDSAAQVAMDFRRWFLGTDREVETILVFTIPRAAFYWLTVALGLVFLVAGVRTEQNAQGLEAWVPPAVAVLSAAVLPALAGSWIYSRGDTTRFVIFGYADLAFWGACFLWFCVAVVPLFMGRLRVGLQRDAWMTLVMAGCLLFVACIPLLEGPWRLRVAQVSLAAVPVLSLFTFITSRVTHQTSGSLNFTLLLLTGCSFGYYSLWGWEGQDAPAMFLAAQFMVMVVSGWRRGMAWWQITDRPYYDRIVWLHPLNRLFLALLLTLAGAAVLYCSFPLVQSGGWIRGYNSYCMLVCVLPFVLCAVTLAMVDLLQKEIH